MIHATALLSRKPYSAPSGATMVGELCLAPARVHEFCGPARRTLAMMLARNMGGPVLWIQCDWDGDTLHGPGVREFVDPGRITFARPKRAEDVLWCMEEALRAGCVPLVVAELRQPPALTPVRRLHLAAETGAGRKACKPLGLLLTPGDGGAQGVETRWNLAPRHTGGQDGWMLQRRRARMAPPSAWPVRMGSKGPDLGAELAG